MKKQKEQLLIRDQQVLLVKHCTQVNIYINGEYKGFSTGWVSAKTLATKLIVGDLV